MVEGKVSKALPPEFEIHIASAPRFTASKASSTVMIPWTITGFEA